MKEENELIPEGVEQITMFKNKEIRKILHDDEWFFSVVDVVEAVTDSVNPRDYWYQLKKRELSKTGIDLSTDCRQLKLSAKDGSMRETECASPEIIFRIVQSIPSPKVEPLKKWLAKTGYERIQEIQNPEIAIKRAITTYKVKGYSDEWIDARIRTILTRKELTDEWKDRGVKDIEYAILTNIISTETFGIDTQNHKNFKALKKHHSLRDNMTDLELILTMLGEKSTRSIGEGWGYCGNRKKELRKTAW